MRIAILAPLFAASLALAASPVTIIGLDAAALAKDGGNGGGNGGGHSESHGGGNGNGNSNQGNGSGSLKSQGGDKGKSGEAHGKSENNSGKSENAKSGKTVTTREKNVSAQLAGLNSLNRNYKALMHTSDPRMTAISAYAMAYARYEIANGTEPSPDDPLLGDDALEDALASATKSGEISPAAFDRAKTILGVGDANGKIDQIRESLENSASTTTQE